MNPKEGKESSSDSESNEGSSALESNPKEGTQNSGHLGTNEVNTALEYNSREGHQGTAHLVSNPKDSALEQNSKERKENTAHTATNEMDSASEQNSKERKENTDNLETREANWALKHDSTEGKESAAHLEAKKSNSASQSIPKESKETTAHSDTKESYSAAEHNPNGGQGDKASFETKKAEHKKSSSSSSPSSDSSLHSMNDERDILTDANFSNKPGGESPLFSEDGDDMQCSTTTQSPPTQIMGRSPGYDPNRIPASVFASKPSTPMEWSVASNESLFSIHVGNSSFSKDQFYLLMGRSGELPRLDEELDTTIGLPPVREGTDGYAHGDDKNYNPRISETSAAHPQAGYNGAANYYKKDRMISADDVLSSIDSPVAPRFSVSRSDDTRASDVSNRSFAFPVLAGDGGRSNSALGETKRHKSHRKLQTHPVTEQQSQPELPKSPIKPDNSSWLSCFACRWRICC